MGTRFINNPPKQREGRGKWREKGPFVESRVPSSRIRFPGVDVLSPLLPDPHHSPPSPYARCTQQTSQTRVSALYPPIHSQRATTHKRSIARHTLPTFHHISEVYPVPRDTQRPPLPSFTINDPITTRLSIQ